ncbi:TetR/AcrR family transcriptional regulator [uncultured Hyphomonas sp.]|uniref:TetR/AcrR family transcriptional regulator n=1 Tax=uncultured Hyphomonas sp. TaxID=225298 RepID=UPI002AABC365|nr:TetR/AcrR family transcriptional regulator [uncultured Hyphomonas sp.]
MQRARTEEAKDERRQALLSAALDEFFEKGFAATRMDDVARRAHLSKGALYLYFDSKDALFQGLVESLATPNLEIVEQITQQAATLKEALRGIRLFAPNLIRQTELPRLMKVLIGDSQMFPDLVQTYRRELIDRVLSMIASLLKRANDSGEASIAHPELTARLVMAPIVLSALWQAVFNQKSEADVNLDQLFEIHEQMLLNALRIEAAS